MDTILGFTSLLLTTILALFAALAMQMALLKAAFFLMQPAAANRPAPRPSLEHGTQLLVRAYARTK